MNLPDLILHELERRLEPAVEKVRLVRVPADAKAGMIAAVVEDLADARQALRVGPVHLELNVHAVILSERGAFAKRLAYLLQRLLFRDVFRQTIRPHLHARRSEVVRELHPFFGLVDVLAHDRLVCGVIFAGRPETADLHRRVLETLADIRPSLRRQRNLDAVLVRRPELHGVHPDLCEVLDDRRDIPVLRNLVRDGAELQTGPCRGRSGRLQGSIAARAGRAPAARKSRLFMARA